MKIFHSDGHRAHSPDAFIVRGQRKRCPEVPERATLLMNAVAPDHDPVAVTTNAHPSSTVRRIHDPDYLHFLETAWSRWIELPDHAPEILPNVHPGRSMSGRPDHIVGMAGYYQSDTACPIGPGTWQAAVASAQVAERAAQEVHRDGASFAYALCRPPGHHAFADSAGGFCFLNNSAIAAQYCLDNGAKRVAILDVDVHHGNGTQGIFESRDDVLTISLHGDPAHSYPFYAGYAHETGKGRGDGFNLNLPLPQGTGDGGFLEALSSSFDKLECFDPDTLIVALGLDASEHDPLAFLHVTTNGFEHIAQRIAALGLPTVLVQEGGYISDVLGANLAAFLGGFESAWPRH